MPTADSERNRTNSRIESALEKLNALSCIKILIVVEMIFKIIKGIVIGIVLYIKRNEEPETPLKLFLFVYMLFCFMKSGIFYIKNKGFFYIQSIPEYEDNNDISLFNNLLEAMILSWYIVGCNWIQDCETCREKNPLLYYMTIIWISFGFFTFVAPLFAIVLLLVLVRYVRPKLVVITYNDPQDIPNDSYTCAICFDDYIQGSRVKFLPCDHHYHENCIDEWFNVKDNCPLCKKNVNMIYDIVEMTDPVNEI